MKVNFYKRYCNNIKEFLFLICLLFSFPIYGNDEQRKMNSITIEESIFFFNAKIMTNSWYFNFEKDKRIRIDLFFRYSVC